ncbi:hypothetical protein Tco_0412127 [Tanacetum coccineum]
MWVPPTKRLALFIESPKLWDSISNKVHYGGLIVMNGRGFQEEVWKLPQTRYTVVDLISKLPRSSWERKDVPTFTRYILAMPVGMANEPIGKLEGHLGGGQAPEGRDSFFMITGENNSRVKAFETSLETYEDAYHFYPLCFELLP